MAKSSGGKSPGELLYAAIDRWTFYNTEIIHAKMRLMRVWTDPKMPPPSLAMKNFYDQLVAEGQRDTIRKIDKYLDRMGQRDRERRQTTLF